MRFAVLFVGCTLSSLLPAQQNSGRGRISCRECNYTVERPCNLAECPGADTSTRSPFEMYYPNQQPVERSGTISASELRHALSTTEAKTITDARAKFSAGRTEEALADLKKAEDKSSLKPYALSVMGEIRLRLGDVEGAVKALRNAVALLPIAGNYSNLGFALCLLNRCEEGRAEIERSIKLDRNAIKPRFLLGILLLDESGKETEAEAQLERVQKAIPAAHLALAVLHERRGEPDAAEKQLRQLLGDDTAKIQAYQRWTKTVAANEKPSRAFQLRLEAHREPIVQ
jgi:tetratricopeptide (TPR) repeat protein